MSNLDNLISKIITDSEEESKKTVEAARKEASETVRKAADAARKEKERILAEADSEAEKAAEQMLLRKRLEIRDETLSAKREVIDRVFDGALKKLNDLPRDKYLKYLSGGLPEGVSGGEFILPSKYEVKEDELKVLFAGKEVSLYKGGRSVGGGFILIKDGVEYNRSFEALVGYYRHELEGEIIKILF